MSNINYWNAYIHVCRQVMEMAKILDRFLEHNNFELYFELSEIQERLINEREKLIDFITYDSSYSNNSDTDNILGISVGDLKDASGVDLVLFND